MEYRGEVGGERREGARGTRKGIACEYETELCLS